ncbi:hypothetical protein J6590_033527 [Homalodisca vitripennis]|nr:hypothetical protein J6590_033527 [Homalodisca vitripennis]
MAVPEHAASRHCGVWRRHQTPQCEYGMMWLSGRYGRARTRSITPLWRLAAPPNATVDMAVPEHAASRHHMSGSATKRPSVNME